MLARSLPDVYCANNNREVVVVCSNSALHTRKCEKIEFFSNVVALV